MRIPRRIAALLAAFAFTAGAARALADVDVDVHLGHGGSWVQDAATPLIVELRGSGSEGVQVEIAIRGGDLAGRDEVRLERTVLLGPGVTRREVFLVPGAESYGTGARVALRTTPSVPIRSRSKTGDKGRLEVALEPGGSFDAVAASFESHVIGVVNDRRSVLASLLPAATRPGQVVGMGAETEDRIYVVPIGPEAVALGPLGLDGVEILVVCDPDASFVADPREADALLDWVALGGRLVVSLGENAAQFPASPLAAELPARWAGVDVADASAIARRLGVPDTFGPLPRRPVPCARLAPDARASGTDAFPPELVAFRRFGCGEIAVLGCDVRGVVEILPKERGAVRPVLDALMFVEADRAVREATQAWDPSYDVSTGFGSLLQGTAFRPPPLPLVLLGLLTYLLVVGPLDWFLLRRMKKERWTTFTFAGAVLVFTLFAYGVSLLLFSSDAVVNRIAFLQFTQGGREGRELVRVRDLAGHYAPVGASRACRWTLPAAVVGSALPGLPESGGVGAKHPVLVEGNDPAAPAATVDVAFRSQRVVSSIVVGPAGRTLDARVQLQRDALRVDVENGLACPISDAFLIVPGGKGLELGSLDAGAKQSYGGRPVALSSAPWHGSTSLSDPENVHAVRSWLRRIVASASVTGERPAGFHALRRSGIVVPRPVPGRAVLVAFAAESPLPLPGEDLGGIRHFVVTKEVDLQ